MLQPFLHELVSCVRAPMAALSGPDGQIRPGGASGVYALDTRYLSEFVVTLNGVEPIAVGDHIVDRSGARFVGAVMGVANVEIADATVRLERVRQATSGGVHDECVVVNDGRHDARAILEVRLACDFASMVDVKHGGPTSPRPPSDTQGGDGVAEVRWRGPAGEVVVRVDGPGASITVAGREVFVTTAFDLPSRSRRTIRVEVEIFDDRAPRWFQPAGLAPAMTREIRVESAHPQVAPLVHRSVDDLDSLLMADAAGNVFATAGSPWFLTLFGRDALWAARFALPLGTALAGGTLRALAGRQATIDDVRSGAQPGKIIHEVRLEPLTWGETTLTTEYYGTVDATPLWVSLLHDSWCWGLDDDTVSDLLGPMERAVDWIVAQRAETGFLSYRDVSGHGLANQGWKDSGDSIQHADGTVAAAPITLCEVQAYAHRALLDAARLLEAFDRPGAGRARDIAAEIAKQFRDAFWVESPLGRFPAVAIDGDGVLVDSLTSNIGHLLGTGLLDGDEELAVARLLGENRLGSGYGLRTLAADHPHFNPLGYHSGSVWPHDTAIAIDGLVRAGHHGVAATLATGLLDGAVTFDHRFPELFGGWERGSGPPLAYPAACRPQAWSAAAAVSVLRAACGLEVDLPAGRVSVDPNPTFAALFPLRVSGLRVGAAVLDIAIDASGMATVITDAPLTVTTPSP